MPRFTAFTGCSLVLLSIGACGDDAATTHDTADATPTDTAADTTPADSAPDTTPDTAPDIAPDTTVADVPADTAQLESLSFQFLDGYKDAAPIAGVNVRWIPPGGGAQDLVSDADGRVSVAGIDWSKGGASLAAAKPGYLARGVAGSRAEFIDERLVHTADGDLYVSMESLENDTRHVHITGVAQGAASDGNLLVSPDVDDSTYSFQPGVAFDFLVPRNTPFNWAAFTGHEVGTGRILERPVLAWATGASPSGASADMEMPLDFAHDAITPKTHSGAFPNVAHEHSTLADKGLATVYVFASPAGGFIGVANHAAPNVDNLGYDYGIEWVEPAWAKDPITEYEIDNGDESSRTYVRGLPPDTDATVVMLEPPAWTAMTPGAIDQPLTWFNVPAQMDVALYVYDGVQASAPILGAFTVGRGVTSFTLPTFPGDVDLFALAESQQLGVQVMTCLRDPAFDAGACRQQGLSSIRAVNRASP